MYFIDSCPQGFYHQTNNGECHHVFSSKGQYECWVLILAVQCDRSSYVNDAIYI